MTLEQALAAVAWVVREAEGPVSVFVADDHGELVAAATMDGFSLCPGQKWVDCRSCWTSNEC